MPSLAAVSPGRHGNKRFKRYTNYKFAADRAIVPLVINELPRAALALPIGFTAHDDQLLPAAILGLKPGQNLLVGPDGRWLGGYIPALLRTYPFVLAPHGDHDVLCIDESSELITSGSDGEPFFEEGGPSKPIAALMSVLEQIAASRKATVQACAVLKAHDLVRPWPITIKIPAGEQRVEGLLCIDEAALAALPDAAFLELRRAGALVVIYCQLLSMHNMTELARVASARAEAGARRLPVNQAGELELEFLNDSPLMDFSKLR
jgi:hypothetical protein